MRRRVGEEEVGEEDKHELIWALSLCLFLMFDLLLTPGCHHGNGKWRANLSQCTSVSNAVSRTSLSNASEQSSRMSVVTMSSKRLLLEDGRWNKETDRTWWPCWTEGCKAMGEWRNERRMRLRWGTKWAMVI